MTGKPKLLTGFRTEVAGPVAKLSRGRTLDGNDARILLGHGIELFSDIREADIEEEARGEPVDGVID
jgi:hypothetical protein